MHGGRLIKANRNNTDNTNTQKHNCIDISSDKQAKSPTRKYGYA